MTKGGNYVSRRWKEIENKTRAARGVKRVDERPAGHKKGKEGQ